MSSVTIGCIHYLGTLNWLHQPKGLRTICDFIYVVIFNDITLPIFRTQKCYTQCSIEFGSHYREITLQSQRNNQSLNPLFYLVRKNCILIE